MENPKYLQSFEMKYFFLVTQNLSTRALPIWTATNSADEKANSKKIDYQVLKKKSLA